MVRHLLSVAMFAILCCCDAALAGQPAPLHLGKGEVLDLHMPIQPKPKDKAVPAPDDADLPGYYICKGKQDGKPYSGVASIRKIGDVYLVHWYVGDGFYGIGIRQGDRFSVSWAASKEGKITRGINVYRIEAGPKLIGKWAILPGNGQMSDESLLWLRAFDKELGPDGEANAE